MHGIMIRVLAILAITAFTTVSLAVPLANEQLVFLTKAGQDESGSPLLRIADSSDPRLAQLYTRLTQNQGVQKVSSSHLTVESEKLAAAVPAGYHSVGKPQPVYIEVGSGSGTYNDWKGSFSIQDPSGRTQSYDHPRVVLDLNDSIFRSNDPSIVEQTVVHEIAHGVMRMAYGKDSLPHTEWLGRSHYGDLVTDNELALIEGWAEFAGAYFTGRNTIAEDPAEAITQNAYAYKDDGTPKPPQDLFRTEGWAATVLLHIANHPNIHKGYEKLVAAMKLGKPQGFNDLIRQYMTRNPEDSKSIEEILSKDSINQINTPLGGPVVATAPGDPLPPPIDQPTIGNDGGDQELIRLFNDFQSSLNTYAQLRLDQMHVDWYRGAHPGEIQRRMSFQYSLVKSLHARLITALQQTQGVENQELIAQFVLDNLDKIRFEHNRSLQSYQKTNWWNRSVKARLDGELKLYKELYSMNKNLADNVDPAAVQNIWNQRQIRLQYRVQQREVVAAPMSSGEDCNAALDPDCEAAYNKLIGAIKANKRAHEARTLLQGFSQK
jgi:hypothetical protein